MADAQRASRMADRVKVIVAKALERRVKDPRLGFVTVTDARVTNDLQHATVYYTVYGTAEEKADSARALESAKGILRAEVGKNITARLTPTLEFVADEIPEAASNLEDVLRRAKEKDAAVAASAAGASYANGENSYRTDEAEVADSAASEAEDEDPSGTRER
ncbi:30S ribosome-binding factor RbfA [Kocuria sp. p3-SID1433]|uniref:30S ribosome-binding factor RbfA n=1 Tax=unclassified Kocuria TaxID=2649579 RepID=UPI0021A8130D|nr:MULTISPECIES: 30S ribosome-binding factor RbfA [unclassified Kocuria]MCT1602557.1 30S ribosome-binding factor RbfA [Kocuria sp. p3-SID1428]MCT2181233.1 30S ribosome-binding factor RbfA [Kocuria sp. p3-SID1433]